MPAPLADRFTGTYPADAAPLRADPHSCAQPDKVVVTHLDLDLTLDFTRRALHGAATLTLDWKDPRAHELVLDDAELVLHGIEALDDDGSARPLGHALTPAPLEGGSRLDIHAPEQPRRVRIAYETAPDAAGLQWLAPEQTAGKTQAFMFSQSEATHARSWIPLQDTPAVRFTWSARIAGPRGTRIAMSAPNDASHPTDASFAFSQPHPVPSYLMAIAAGAIEAREVGPRSAIYAEPPLIERAVAEFSDTERMIDAAEALFGPYPWGRYDVLVLPPSFPYGGMENPNLTFATPTVLVGDKSLVSLVAHELAHSWSGNLVTAAGWRHIWLNEGITTYVQGRITESLYGTRQANEETLLAIQNLRRVMAGLPTDLQRLVPQGAALAADDLLTKVAYDKGSWLMRALEARFGRARFDAWLRGYFEHFAWRSITTEEMLTHLDARLLRETPEHMTRQEVEAWIERPGIPADAPVPASAAFAAIDAQRRAFLDGALPTQAISARDWNTQEWMYFLDGLPEKTALERIRALDATWHLTGTANAEIGMRWYRRAIAAGDRSVWSAAAEHMTRIGRLYLTLPLYQALAATPEGLARALAVFQAARAGYHPLTQQHVLRVLNKAARSADAQR